jgi:flagellar assembly factor FliW
MQVNTSRFQVVEYTAQDCLVFPEGIIGFEHLNLWLLLNDDALSWLQSVETPDVAIPVVNPFVYVPNYKIRIAREACAENGLNSLQNKQVLSVVSFQNGVWSMNLRAPVFVSFAERLGWQFITIDEQPLRHALPRTTLPLRKTA